MPYTPHSTMELGDAMLGQLAQVLVAILDHTIPSVHNVVNWEVDSTDLGPIVPEWGGEARTTNKMLITPQSKAQAA
ncbi:hypothetical protein BBJ29_007618 [Phytophthora kernoviae]|uniref:Uncharacterized protein n=2 Tax=Phytophthora kernoviae TaxID=325452 RepID=A0A3F2RIF9_9STRA|nr:hypothetical protein G195_009135 [Phytophthora kernoviae 00238/432]RLN47814.1 hypothetical protein BBJ29_007618 [Phytophthora kernoviae]RLN57617.1 hypothetical protein BBP00_00007420 [Phytophthora kernoviae]